MFGDITKGFGKNFFIAYLAPAILFISANVLLVISEVLKLPNWLNWKVFEINSLSNKAVALLLFSTFAALMLQQFNQLIVAIYSGTVGANFIPIFWVTKSFHKRRFIKLRNERDKVDAAGFASTYELSRMFSHEGNILPTRLGNIINSFEYYVYKAYNIDHHTIWVRLVGVIPDSYKREIEKSQTDFNFLINLSLLSVITGVECLILSSYQIWPKLSMALLICSFLSYIFYRASCSSAEVWGEYVRAAFDLYRYDLLKQIGVFLPSKPITLQEEKGIWAVLQEYIFYGIDPGGSVFPRALEFLPGSSQAKQVKGSENEDCD